MKLKKLFSTSLTLAGITLTAINLKGADDIRLIIRADDIGSSHAANVACIKAYKEGIARSVELMVPGPWFPEAVKVLKENPGLDVGVHLVLTSEWANMKWRPLTHAPSLTDADGYFFPMIWPNANFPSNAALKTAQWKLEEVEKELRAQIETAIRHVPQISHLSSHMGCTGFDPRLVDLEKKLAKEYHLELELKAAGVKSFRGWAQGAALKDRVEQFAKNLEALTAGTYVFVEHPGLDVPEMQFLGHKGYENVGEDRQAVTDVFTSATVKDAIQKKGIRLISFKDFKKLAK